MKKEDFSKCSFIDEYMCFVTYNDFCENRQVIKALYQTLSKNEKMFYKWYVYANIFMTEKYKNAIWTFLNFDDFQIHIHLLRLRTRYNKEIRDF